MSGRAIFESHGVADISAPESESTLVTRLLSEHEEVVFYSVNRSVREVTHIEDDATCAGIEVDEGIVRECDIPCS